MASLGAGLAYLLALPIVVIAAAGFGIFFLAIVSPFAGLFLLRGSNAEWLFVAMANVIPEALIGFAAYYNLARVLRARASQAGHLPEHITRALALYLVVLAGGAITIAEWSEPGFGLIAQLFIWPAATAVGAILGEVMGWRWWSRAHAMAA